MSLAGTTKAFSIEITNVGTDGDTINEDETGSFYVYATNTGPLHMTDVSFRIAGLNGTKVKTVLANDFQTSITSASIERVNAHGGNNPSLVGVFLFRAPSAPSGREIELVEVTLEQWDANTNHIMLAHSDPNRTVRGSLSAEVFPD